MNAYWMFWWGRTENPLRQLGGLHWMVIISGLLFFAGCVLVPQRLLERFFAAAAFIAPFWWYWIERVKKLATPVNLLVPQLRQRLLKTSMAHWLAATLLLAFATTIREALDHFFSVGLLMGCGLLTFACLSSLRNVWLAAVGGIGMVCGIYLIASVCRWNDHSSIALIILLPAWLLMSYVAWLTGNILLRDAVARHAKPDQFGKKVPGREAAGTAVPVPTAIHHWFLRRMIRRCGNTTLSQDVLTRIRLETRLNASFGPEFHWSASIPDLFTVIYLFVLISQRQQIADGNFIAIGLGLFFWFFVPSIHKYMEKHRAAPRTYLDSGKFTNSLRLNEKYELINAITPVDNSRAKLMKGLIFLAPGLPQGLALHQALARITLRYCLIFWACCLPVYALLALCLPAPIRVHVLVMVATAELALIGRWVGNSPSRFAEPKLASFERLPALLALPLHLFITTIWPTSLSKYVWLMVAFAPNWYLESISMPLWGTSCLVGGAALVYFRWTKLATEPAGWPASWR